MAINDSIIKLYFAYNYFIKIKLNIQKLNTNVQIANKY